MKRRANYIPAPHYFNLNNACRVLNDAFDSVGVFLVGSALERQDFRDVDVRCILDDEEFERLFPNAVGSPPNHALWSIMCVSISLYLSEQSKLPVDFQIQQMTAANKKHDGKRSALGIFVGYPGGG